MSKSQRKFRVREVIGWWCCLSSGVRLGISVSERVRRVLLQVSALRQSREHYMFWWSLACDHCHLVTCILSCARMCSSGGFRYRGW